MNLRINHPYQSGSNKVSPSKTNSEKNHLEHLSSLVKRYQEQFVQSGGMPLTRDQAEELLQAAQKVLSQNDLTSPIWKLIEGLPVLCNSCPIDPEETNEICKTSFLEELIKPEKLHTIWKTQNNSDLFFTIVSNHLELLILYLEEYPDRKEEIFQNSQLKKELKNHPDLLKQLNPKRTT